jgi:hypothetical protein
MSEMVIALTSGVIFVGGIVTGVLVMVTYTVRRADRRY